MKRIAVYGGSFNPLHNGHLALAQAVLDEGMADEVWLLVSPHNPLKEQADLLPEHHRLALAKAAVKGKSGICVSDFEFHLPRPSYTWKTLRALSEAYPGCTFLLLIGGDNWKDFGRWANPGEILRNYPVIIYPREGVDIDTAALPEGVTLLSAPLFPCSSTEIRVKLSRGEDVADLLPAEELSLIYKYEWYGTGREPAEDVC